MVCTDVCGMEAVAAGMLLSDIVRCYTDSACAAPRRSTREGRPARGRCVPLAWRHGMKLRVRWRSLIVYYTYTATGSLAHVLIHISRPMVWSHEGGGRLFSKISNTIHRDLQIRWVLGRRLVAMLVRGGTGKVLSWATCQSYDGEAKFFWDSRWQKMSTCKYFTIFVNYL